MSLAIGDSRCDVGQALVYVELVAVAPWNRRGAAALGQLKGLGRLLVRKAVHVSLELGYAGRIGLHSKPASEAFYRDKLGLLDLGTEVAEDGEWVYFEATPEVARGLM